ncbi:hypothetical protein BerOc1_00967 [Pseudodesulfovibrio hydrargyri]|uniref:Uncharacterized protein n=1 Tax=Pseudodesulfovibrio hydrargyri TaxID=2125990 RepID=A0A1J5N2M6_9BACT|nr:hypothetical protein BerOc1_00967 [Pseudodesulfovibrio hydrargyri]
MDKSDLVIVGFIQHPAYILNQIGPVFHMGIVEKATDRDLKGLGYLFEFFD